MFDKNLGLNRQVSLTKNYVMQSFSKYLQEVVKGLGSNFDVNLV